MSPSGPRGCVAPHRHRIGSPDGTCRSRRSIACRFPERGNHTNDRDDCNTRIHHFSDHYAITSRPDAGLSQRLVAPRKLVRYTALAGSTPTMQPNSAQRCLIDVTGQRPCHVRVGSVDRSVGKSPPVLAFSFRHGSGVLLVEPRLRHDPAHR